MASGAIFFFEDQFPTWINNTYGICLFLLGMVFIIGDFAMKKLQKNKIENSENSSIDSGKENVISGAKSSHISGGENNAIIGGSNNRIGKSKD